MDFLVLRFSESQDDMLAESEEMSLIADQARADIIKELERPTLSSDAATKLMLGILVLDLEEAAAGLTAAFSGGFDENTRMRGTSHDLWGSVESGLRQSSQYVIREIRAIRGCLIPSPALPRYFLISSDGFHRLQNS